MTRGGADAGDGPCKILIVDDHPIVREGLALLLAGHPDMLVCAEAEDVAEALRLMDEVRPDLVIVDISLKGGNGIDLIKRIRARHPSARMLVSSMHDEALYAERALRAGAAGYISKQEATRAIVGAIRCVRGGGFYLSESMSALLLKRAVGGGLGRPALSPVEVLSDRELEVFEYVGRGLSTRDIAECLHLSGKTVETYRDRLRRKMNLKDGAELTRHAIRWVLENEQA